MPVHYVHHPRPTIDIGPHVFPIEKYAILCAWLRDKLGVEDVRWHEAESVERADLERVAEGGPPQLQAQARDLLRDLP